MPKKRSKQAKIKAKQHRQAQPESRVQVEVKPSYNRQLFAYDPKLILTDLRKTLVVSLIILLVLAFFALRYT